MIWILLSFSIPFDYIFPGVGARGLSCSSYFTSYDITSIWWNPANICVKSPSLYIDWTNLIQNFHLYNLSTGFNAYGVNLALGINYFTSGVMPLNPEIEDSIIPENIDYFSVNERVITLSLSRKIKLVSIGFNIKNYEQEIVDFHGTGFGYDIGLTFEKKLRISIIIKDLMNTKLSWFGKIIDKIPQTTIIATSLPYKFKDYHGFTEISYILNDYNNFFSFGSEITIRDIVSIRAGYSQLKKISFGIGLDFFRISMYYTLMTSNFEPTHIIGFMLKRGI